MTALIVWDFDGVLNANMRGGRPVWTDMLQATLGLDPKALSAHLFRSNRMRDILRGRLDIRAALADWLATQDTPHDADALLDHWFHADARPDAQVLGWLQATPARHVIGTNNEPRRAAFIESAMGYSQHVERLFASGSMGVAKPDPGFFAQIERWAGLVPSQILLIDDAAANIAAARARGWQTFHFTEQTRNALPSRLGL